jgi:hypothetical protein
MNIQPNDLVLVRKTVDRYHSRSALTSVRRFLDQMLILPAGYAIVTKVIFRPERREYDIEVMYPDGSKNFLNEDEIEKIIKP